MHCAVLCNGPSRISYKSREGYDFVIGCNIPWTEVDATVVFDREIVNYYSQHSEEIKHKIYFSRHAWMHTDAIRRRHIFQESFEGIVDPRYPFYSCGHGAVEILIKQKKATDIDIYGCDSWFSYDLQSHTHQYANTSYPNEEKCVNEWRAKWNEIITNNPNVSIQFIK